MKCPNCKNKMNCTQSDYHYTESGLNNIYLSGIEIYHCSCGEEIISLPTVNQLHDLIAIDLIKQKHRLNGRELRFLRKNMGLTAKKLGGYLGIDNATISRWEKGSQPISSPHDRLFRLLYLNMRRVPQDEINAVIQKDFTSISDEQVETPPFMIPREKWSKTGICFQ